MPHTDPEKRRAYERRRSKSAHRKALHRRLSVARRLTNPELMRAQARANHASKREDRNAKARANYAKHRDTRLAAMRAKYAADPLKYLNKCRRYQQANPAIIASQNARKRARRLAVPVSDFSAAQWLEIKRAGDFRCVYCEAQVRRLTMDHLTPLSQGGMHTLHNILPACQRCNSKKNTGVPLCPVQPFLLTIAHARKTS